MQKIIQKNNRVPIPTYKMYYFLSFSRFSDGARANMDFIPFGFPSKFVQTHAELLIWV